MLNIYGNHFEYAGQSSRKYGLTIAVVESSPNYSIMGKTETVSVYSDISKKQHFVSTNYEKSAVTFEAEVVSDTPMPLHIQREVQRWLFNQHGYRKLYVDMADDCMAESAELVDGVLKRTYMNCRFTNPSRLEYNGGVVGYKFTLECDGPMAWQDPISKTISISNTSTSSNKTVTVQVDTDLNDFTYPQVTLTIGKVGGEIIIVNQADDPTRLTKFVALKPNAKIVMKPEIGYVTEDCYDLFLNKNFMRLVNGENRISVTGNVTSMELKWQNGRYI